MSSYIYIRSLFFYLINGFIISFSQKITLRKGFQRIFVYNDKHREHATGIKKSYVLNALFGGILCVFVSSFYGYWYSSLIVCVFLALLTVVSAVDYTTMEIPNIFVLAAFVLGIFSVYTMPGISLISRVLGIFVVSVPLFLLTLLIPGAFGGGDIKLMAACGLFLGIKLTLISFAFAVLTGGVYGSWLLVMKKKTVRNTLHLAHFYVWAWQQHFSLVTKYGIGMQVFCICEYSKFCLLIYS